MIDVSNYKFKYLTDKIVKVEESFINSYIVECLKSEITIIYTHRMRVIVDAKYKKVDLNKFMTDQFQHLTPSK